MRRLFALLESIEIHLREINDRLLFICHYIENHKRERL